MGSIQAGFLFSQTSIASEAEEPKESSEADAPQSAARDERERLIVIRDDCIIAAPASLAEHVSKPHTSTRPNREEDL